MSGRASRTRALLGLLAAFALAQPATAQTPDAHPVLPVSDGAAALWDLAAHFDSGYRVYARFLVTNEGPGDRTAVAFGHVIHPDGKTTRFQNGRRQGRWDIEDRGRRIAIGSSELLLADNVRRLEVDNDKRGIEIRIDVPEDGSAIAARGHPLDTFHVLNLATRATGRLWLEGMAAQVELTGRAVLTHMRLGAPEADLMRRRIDVAVWDEDGALFLTSVDRPSGERWSWLAALRRGAPPRAMEGLTVTTRPAETEGGYPIPVELQVTGKGIDGVFSLRQHLLRVDPLDALPTLLKLMYSLRTQPLHTWADASADLVTPTYGLRSAPGGSASGASGYAALYFTDSLPPVTQP